MCRAENKYVKEGRGGGRGMEATLHTFWGSLWGASGLHKVSHGETLWVGGALAKRLSVASLLPLHLPSEYANEKEKTRL